MYNITVIPGDGIGPEVTEATLKVLEATGVPLRWQTAEMGHGAWERHGNPVPPETIEAMRKSDASLKGPCTTARGAPYRSANVTFRLELDLFACVRPCKAYPGIRTPFPGTDLVVIRESTEDRSGGGQFPAGSPQAQAIIEAVRATAGKAIPSQAALSVAICTEAGTTRLARFAFDYARANGRRKVTVGVKGAGSNHVDVLFWRTCEAVAKDYPDIEFEYDAIDALCLQLVRRPQHYDVLLLPGGYGDLLSDLCAGLVGGLGMAGGSNYSADLAVFEAAHGSAPKYAGQDKVNPMALVLSGAFMLRHLGEAQAAERVEAAVAAQVAEGRCLTYDVAPTPETIHGTREVAEELAKRVRGF
ncbi:MAG: isocitrate/isopropylmalate dehydrogenase family protein [Chloroflexi bacterium]|nr:isocitrate/isopropylmalate dehydrogenase family protein [Chloroflexota bacterium]